MPRDTTCSNPFRKVLEHAKCDGCHAVKYMECKSWQCEHCAKKKLDTISNHCIAVLKLWDDCYFRECRDRDPARRMVRKKKGQFFWIRLDKGCFGFFANVPIGKQLSPAGSLTVLGACLKEIKHVRAWKRKLRTVWLPKADTYIDVGEPDGTRILNVYGSSRDLAIKGLEHSNWKASPMKIGKLADDAQVMQAIVDAGLTAEKKAGERKPIFFFIPKHLPPQERERILRQIQRATMLPKREVPQAETTLARFVAPVLLPIQSRACECGECEILLAG